MSIVHVVVDRHWGVTVTIGIGTSIGVSISVGTIGTIGTIVTTTTPTTATIIMAIVSLIVIHIPDSGRCQQHNRARQLMTAHVDVVRVAVEHFAN